MGKESLKMSIPTIPPKNFADEVVLPEISSFALKYGYGKEYSVFTELMRRSSGSFDVRGIRKLCNAFNRHNRLKMNFYEGKFWTFRIVPDDPFLESFELNPEIEIPLLYSKLDELRYIKVVFWIGLVTAAIFTSRTNYFFVVLVFAVLPFIVPTIMRRFV